MRGGLTHVTLVVQGPAANENKRAALRNIEGLDVIETGLDVEWRDPEGQRRDARAHRELLRIADRVRPDVVHLNGCTAKRLPASQRIPS